MTREATRVDSSTRQSCERCGYDLRGIPGRKRCPECGTPIPRNRRRLALRRTQRGRTTFLVILAGSYAVMGLGAIELLVMAQSIFTISCAFPALFIVVLPLAVLCIALTMLVEKPRARPAAYAALALAVLVTALRAGYVFVSAIANV